MKCPNQKLVPHPKFKDEQESLLVPCGKCVVCMKNRISEWTQRLVDESKNHGRHYFLTLTYSSEPEDYVSSDITQFINLLRKSTHAKIRYYLVGERGSQNNRVHYHALIFTDIQDDIRQNILQSWRHGFIYTGDVNPATCAYVCKYIVPPSPGEATFIRSSRRPGIGSNVLTDRYIESQANNPRTYRVQNGYKKSLPRYYRKKLEENGIVFERYVSKSDATAEYIRRNPDDLEKFLSTGTTYFQDRLENETINFRKNLKKTK